MISSTRSRCSISSRCAGPMRSACARRLRAHLQVAPGHDVVERRHALEERDVLERARDARARRPRAAPCRGAPRREADRALLRVVDAVDDVEQRALAGAVRADDRADLVLAHVEATRRSAPSRRRTRARCPRPRARLAERALGGVPRLPRGSPRQRGLAVPATKVCASRIARSARTARAPVLERHLRLDVHARRGRA